MPPETAAAPVPPVATTAAPVASATPGASPVSPRQIAAATAERPAVHDLTPATSIAHKIVFTPAQTLALLREIDPSAPEGKLAERVQVQVGPQGELTFLVTFRA